MTALDYRSGLEEYADPSRGRAGNWLSWAIYLGMSWTWCIGMYLPVLLVRDYGIWGWIIFAIPNVVGAAAMGWVLKDRVSEAIVIAHRDAIQAFSLITATFQIFFALWMFEQNEVTGAALACICFALVCYRASRRDLDAQSISIVVLMGSLTTMLFAAMNGFLHAPPSANMNARSILDLCALMPVSCFGFLFCPYLDATFHRARQHLHDSHAQASFTTGFGVFFFLMLLYSLGYASPIDAGIAPRYQWAGIMGHWTIQLGLTAGFHWYGITREGEPARSDHATARIVSTLAAAAAVWSMTQLTHWFTGETVYRCFIGFYGLLFPAYVWLCMIPGRGRSVPTKRQWQVLAAAVVLAAPLYWLGFVAQKMLWLVPGLAIVLLARLLIPRPQKPAEAAETPEAATF